MCIFFPLLIPAFVTYFVRKLALCAFLNTGRIPKFEQCMQAGDVVLISFYQFLSTNCRILEPRMTVISLGPSRLISSDVGRRFMSTYPLRYTSHATHNRGIVFKVLYFLDDIIVLFQNTYVECEDHLKCLFLPVIYVPNIHWTFCETHTAVLYF